MRSLWLPMIFSDKTRRHTFNSVISRWKLSGSKIPIFRLWKKNLHIWNRSGRNPQCMRNVYKNLIGLAKKKTNIVTEGIVYARFRLRIDQTYGKPSLFSEGELEGSQSVVNETTRLLTFTFLSSTFCYVGETFYRLMFHNGNAESDLFRNSLRTASS